eukprot:5992324-Amphidinium_carterae.1
MSKRCGCRLSVEEAAVLCESASFWPGSMLEKDTFMELLANILSLEFQSQIDEWEKQLVAAEALGDGGKVDVQLFLAASSLATQVSDPGNIMIPEVGLQSLAPTGTGSRADASEISETLVSTSSSTQLPLPVPELTVGAVVSVASKHYEINEKLGCGAGGSVHQAFLRREAADDGGRHGKGGGPASVALKLAGGGSELAAVGFRPMDTRLAAIAVEAVAAAEVRRMAEDEVKRWEGRIFLPVLYAVGKVEAVGEVEVHNMSAMVVEQADGTLHGQCLAGDALVRVAWALACTLSALNKVGVIHGDLKPQN